LLTTTVFSLLVPNLLTYKGKALNILAVSVITLVRCADNEPALLAYSVIRFFELSTVITFPK
jgi:hypothetical protein